MTIPAAGIGMHLYTMRDVLAEDYPGTLKRLAGIGYQTVGVSGRFGNSAEEIRSFADDAGLSIVLEHVGYSRMADNWSGALADVRTLGGQWVVVPSIPSELHSVEGFRTAAAAFTEAGKAARDAGLKLLFHNHGRDFAEVDGQILFDILLDVDPELLGFEFDLYWAVEGGQDPAKLFQEHPGRFPRAACEGHGRGRVVGGRRRRQAGLRRDVRARRRAESSSGWSSTTSRPTPGCRPSGATAG